jgi:pyruvate formate lyase activating enzyme
MEQENNLPLIVDIKRDSREDGPGIRSVVFFKGCPLRCFFCQNPEAQVPEMEIAFSSRECIQCGKCEEACPQKAIDLRFPGRIHRQSCIRCGRCAGVCPGKGLRVIGTYYPPETLTEILLRDSAFYKHSGGGVTLSGGECTLYPDYLECLLNLLKVKGVHIVLETCGYFDFGRFEQKVLPYIDLVYFDIKFADSYLHRKYTGKSNRLILDNFRRLLRTRKVKIHPRIPMIPGVTATRENLSAIVDFLCEAGAENVSLLSYNPLGMEMYPCLGKPGPLLPDKLMKPDEEQALYAMFTKIIERKKRSGSMAQELLPE